MNIFGCNFYLLTWVIICSIPIYYTGSLKCMYHLSNNVNDCLCTIKKEITPAVLSSLALLSQVTSANGYVPNSPVAWSCYYFCVKNCPKDLPPLCYLGFTSEPFAFVVTTTLVSSLCFAGGYSIKFLINKYLEEKRHLDNKD